MSPSRRADGEDLREVSFVPDAPRSFSSEFGGLGLPLATSTQLPWEPRYLVRTRALTCAARKFSR